MSELGYRDDCRAAFKEWDILTLPSAYILEHFIYVKNNINKYEDLHNYKTRGRFDLVPDHCRLKRCQCRPSHLGLKLFNKLPVRVKSYLIKRIL